MREAPTLSFRQVFFQEKGGSFAFLYARLSTFHAIKQSRLSFFAGNRQAPLRLLLNPSEAVDYVVVHELAHIKEKNHSARFYALVERYMPDYREREKLLKKTPKL